MRASYYEPKIKKDEEYNKLSDYEQRNSNSALNAYTQQKQLDDELVDSQRTAYFNNEKIMKYLPNQLKANGLSNNVGANSQMRLDANNNYMNQLAQINKNYNDASNQLNLNYQNELKSNEDASRQKFADELAIESLYKDNIADRSSGFEMTDGYYDQEDVKKLYDYIDNETRLSDTMKNSLKSYIDGQFKVASEEEKEDMAWKKQLANEYQVSTDDEGIDNNSAGVYSFGKFNDTGKNGAGGTQQDPYVNWIIALAKNGKIENGTVVNFNYGAGKPANFVFYNGKWYGTNSSANMDYRIYNLSKVSQDQLNKYGDRLFTQEQLNLLNKYR